ncbi:MAG: methyltransferase [Calothrix sp. MO_192.B10]|nr:methyltransferase [Calothrix sp. MO_192.B10]
MAVLSQQDNVKNTNGILPSKQMMQMITASWVSQSIYAAAKLGIADFLKDGPQTTEQLANAVGADAPSLYRLMRALASVGIFTEVREGCFGSTPLGECLQTDAPQSLRAMATMCGEEHYQAWGNIVHSIKTSECAFQDLYKTSFFKYLKQNTEAEQIFCEAMTNYATQAHISVAAAYDFSGINKIVDVAGGHGTLISSILKANPAMSGILFDIPEVIEGSKQSIKAAGLENRCELVAGDFFKSVPSGGDAYILSTVIHDWNDENSIAILKNCHEAMVENGKLLIVEMVIPSNNEPFFGKILDLTMLAIHGGLERTKAQYQDLFAAAGFKLTNVFPTKSPLSVIEGVRM